MKYIKTYENIEPFKVNIYKFLNILIEYEEVLSNLTITDTLLKIEWEANTDNIMDDIFRFQTIEFNSNYSQGKTKKIKARIQNIDIRKDWTHPQRIFFYIPSQTDTYPERERSDHPEEHLVSRKYDEIKIYTNIEETKRKYNFYSTYGQNIEKYNL